MIDIIIAVGIVIVLLAIVGFGMNEWFNGIIGPSDQGD